MIDNVLYAKREAVKVGRHTFNVHTIETHWQGDPHGKMEDMPGNLDRKSVV